MRTGQEASSAVFGSEHVDHQDETDQRPVGRAMLDVDMKRLRWSVRPQCSPGQRAELEWPADDAAACRQQLRQNVDRIELGAAIDEVANASRSATHPLVVCGSRSHRLVVRVVQSFQLLGGYSPRQHEKTVLVERRGHLRRDIARGGNGAVTHHRRAGQRPEAYRFTN